MKTSKQRKNLLLNRQAVDHGERAARERSLSLSALVEKHLLSLPAPAESDEYWAETLRPARRAGERRFEQLRQKHT